MDGNPTWQAFCLFLAGDLCRSLLLASGVLVAILSIRTSRALARKKQTADLLFATKSDEKLQQGAKCIQKLHDARDANIRNLAFPESAEDEKTQLVKYVLNHLESVSIGVQADIYDEEMLKRCWYGIVTTTYNQTQPLIQALRNRDGKTILQEFEWLARRWEASPLEARK